MRNRLFTAPSTIGYSSWQASASYTATGLDPSTEYTFRVKARDASLNGTALSVEQSATTDAAAPDTAAPTPDPMTWASAPAATGPTSIAMTATTASDPSGGIEYQFACTAGGGGCVVSAWQASASHTATGLDPSTEYTFRVKAHDGLGNETLLSMAQSATTDAPPNTAPVADNQNVGTDEDTPLAVTLTGSDVDGDPLTFAVAIGPSNGSLSGTAPNLTYTPNADYNGPDGFTYTANDGLLDSAAATVSITVNPVNDAPVADAKAVVTDEDTAVGVTLTGSDVDGDPLTFAVAIGPSNGSLSGTAPNLTYTPNADYNGPDGFTYTANDGLLDSAPATVSITVNPINDAPVADAKAVVTDEGVAVAITLTGSDVDGDPLTFAVAIGPSNGSLSGTAPNLTYTPNADYNGPDSFTYTANDGTENSAAATVSITVDPVNDAPVADNQNVGTDEDVAVAVTLTGSDADGDPLTFAVASGPSNGSLSGTAPSLTYTPDADYNGPDSFTYTANDGLLDSTAATVSITVNPINDAPVADNQNVGTDEDVAVGVTLTGSDVDGDPLTFAVASGPTNGSLSGTAPNLTYTPNADYNGPDGFTYTANDGLLDSAPATVSITVNPINDAPVADAKAVVTDEGVAVAITLTGSDVDGDPLTFAVAIGPSNGSLSGTAPNLTYTPNADYNGPDSFTYTANDGTEDSALATVSITVDPINDAPVADNQNVGTDEDVAVGVTLTGTDADGDPLTFAVASGPTNGILSGTAPNMTYTPNAGYSGGDSFTYTANDGALVSAPATVSITVDPINDAPVADNQNVGTDEDVAVGVTLTGTDADGDPLTFAVASGPTNGILSGTAPNMTYTPNAGYSGGDSFTYTANDGALVSAPATVSITVNPDNGAPVANAGGDQTLVLSDTLIITLDGTGSLDPDGDAVTYAWTMVPKFTNEVQHRYKPELRWARDMTSSILMIVLRFPGCMRPGNLVVRSAT